MTQAQTIPCDFETGVYRPPSEGGSNSLLVRFTRNCPWNRCGFCGMYKTEKFEIRPKDEIKRDIDNMAAIAGALSEGRSGGTFTRNAVLAVLEKNPHLGDHPGFGMLVQWLFSGGRTAFLQDANSLIMKTGDLVDVLRHLRSTFPGLERVTSYARSRTLVQKPDDELRAIREAGLDRIHVGLETGDDPLLKKINKGVTSEGHVKGGRKALAAGFQLSEYWMPGLGGKAHWENHARNTARVLNAINPHYIRSRPFYPWPGTPLNEEVEAGTLRLLTADEQLVELKTMIEALDLTSRVCFDHAGNYWKKRDGTLLFTHSYEGYRFPAEKAAVLALIEEGLRAGNRRPEMRSL